MSYDINSTRNFVRKFCKDFITNPYSCYTEHSFHALFYQRFLKDIKPKFKKHYRAGKVYLIQKEYRTATDFGESKKSHWDIAVLDKNAKNFTKHKYNNYDDLKLLTAIEFGLNATKAHLIRDIYRLCHACANLTNGIVIHLQRISGKNSKDMISERDSADSYTTTLEINLDDKENSIRTELAKDIKKFSSLPSNKSLISGFDPKFYKDNLDIYVTTSYAKEIRNTTTNKNHIIHFAPGLAPLIL